MKWNFKIIFELFKHLKNVLNQNWRYRVTQNVIEQDKFKKIKHWNINMEEYPSCWAMLSYYIANEISSKCIMYHFLTTISCLEILTCWTHKHYYISTEIKINKKWNSYLGACEIYQEHTILNSSVSNSFLPTLSHNKHILKTKITYWFWLFHLFIY